MYWTAAEAARELGYGKRTIVRYCSQGRMQATLRDKIWKIESLEIAPPKKKVYHEKTKKVTINYLKKMEPNTLDQKRALQTVLTMLMGNRKTFGEVRQLIDDHFKNHDILVLREFTVEQGIGKGAAVNTQLHRMVQRGIVERIGLGVYAKRDID